MLERLIQYLESPPADGEAFSTLQDLSVAYAMAYRASSEASRLLKAWDINEAALQAVPESDAGSAAGLHFNRALLLQDLALPRTAYLQWQAVLSHERNPFWRQEALLLRDALAPQVKPSEDGGDFDCLSVPSVTNSLLDLLRQWSQVHRTEGSTVSFFSNAQESLKGLESCFPALERSSLAHALRRIVAGPSPDLERLLPRYIQALDAFADRDFEGTRAFLARDAPRSTQLEGSRPLADWIDILDASWCLYDGRPAQALELVEALTAEGRVEDPWVLARAHWIAALASGRLGLLGEANRHYWEAGRYLEDIGEPIQMATLQARLAESYELLGRRAQAWNFRLQGLRTLASLDEQDRRPSALWEAALAAHEQKRPALSLMFLDEAAEILETGKDLPQAAQVHSLRALVSSELDLPEVAQDALTQTQQILRKIPPGPLMQRAQMQLALAEAGRTRLGDSSDDALRVLGEQILGAEQTGHVLDGLTLRYARSRIYRLFGQLEKEEAELRDIVWTATEIRGSIQQAHFDRSYSSAVTESFGRLVELTAQHDLAVEALHFLDASMAYRDRLGRGGLEVRSSAAWSEQIPKGRWIVVYQLGQTHLISWVLDSEGLTLSRRRLSLEDRQQLLISADVLPREEQLNALYQLLLEPMLREREPPEELLTLVQGPLSKIPFAALRPNPDAPYLIERMAVGRLVRLTAPAMENGTTEPPTREPRVFAYGSSRISQGPFSYLDPLPNVRREIESLRSIFPRIDVALDRDVPVDGLKERIHSADIFYFAGHSLAHPDDPWMSLLPLHGPGDLMVTGEDMGAWDLSHLKAVVLSACNTGSARGNGLAPLAVPLLEAGAQSVFGSLWEVSDNSAPEITEGIAKALKNRKRPLSALQEAQVEQIIDPEGDTAWAGWQVYLRPPITVPMVE